MSCWVSLARFLDFAEMAVTLAITLAVRGDRMPVRLLDFVGLLVKGTESPPSGIVVVRLAWTLRGLSLELEMPSGVLSFFMAPKAKKRRRPGARPYSTTVAFA